MSKEEQITIMHTFFFFYHFLLLEVAQATLFFIYFSPFNLHSNIFSTLIAFLSFILFFIYFFFLHHGSTLRRWDIRKALLKSLSKFSFSCATVSH